MHVTIFGIIWILLCVYFFLLELKRLVQLIIVSTVFQAASILSIGSLTIPPLLFTSFVFLIKCVIISIQHKNIFLKKIHMPSWGKPLIYFVFYATIVSIFMPFIFAGIKVLPPYMGIDNSVYYGGVPLRFTASNISQIILLIIYALTALLIYKFRRRITVDNLIKAFLLSGCIVIIVGFWGVLSKQFHLLPFPDSFFYSNTSYALLNDIQIEGFVRATSTFPEASSAGLFLAAFIWAVIIGQYKNYKLIFILGLLLLFFTFSGTGYIAFIIGLAIYLIWKSRKKTISVMFFVLLVIAIVFFSGFNNTISSLLQMKAISQSGVSRYGADIFSYNIFLQTHLLGVGLGSNRGSSFLLTMLANVGIIGITLWGKYNYELISNLFFKVSVSKRNSIVMYAVIFLFGQILSTPDISNSSLWMWLFIGASIDYTKNKSKIRNVQSKNIY